MLYRIATNRPPKESRNDKYLDWDIACERGGGEQRLKCIEENPNKLKRNSVEIYSKCCARTLNMISRWNEDHLTF